MDVCEFDMHIVILSSYEHHVSSKDNRHVITMRYSIANKKMAQFRTHYLTKERAYVSTQQSGYFPMDTEMI